MSNTSAVMKSTASDEFNWNCLNWFHINRYVETMQQRIYRAEILGNKRKVRDLQRILVHSKHCASPYNVELKEYFEERHKREFRRNTVGSRQKLAHIQKYLCPLCKQSITDFREKLVTQLKVPETAGGKYTYKNLELVHNKCGQYWND